MAAFGIPVARTTRCAPSAPRSSSARPSLPERPARRRVRRQDRGANGRQHRRGDRRRPEQGQAFATGDAVNVAQRLEAAAAGVRSWSVIRRSGWVRDAVFAEPIAPLYDKP
jgi:class 3 adenylate cyclase